ncbi:(Fe-S)-binding protein [Nitrosomonas sp. JL21]|uniref:(Fe-S)-binding protein n=1 Tax=Nitrosomonas sp. JL21 TaxID=153949 RepID=UPI001F045501|nr:(Fe-S)-binding protein [Nitrosomonas sp. JL21]
MANHWQEVYPAEGQVRGHVGLFLGCIARIADVATLNSSIFVLNRLGYTVHVPLRQTCCGALYQHRGELRQAATLAQQNKSSFEELEVDWIISTASGCGVQLLESGVGNENCQVIDINQFLVTAKGWEGITIASLPQKILVHDPCSLRNVVAGHAYAYQIISLIPDAQAIPLAGNDQCCGAAGTYFIEHSAVADILRESKISAALNGESSYLVTSNIGCALYIADGLYEKDARIEVLHPVTLLARQMGLQL